MGLKQSHTNSLVNNDSQYTLKPQPIISIMSQNRPAPNQVDLNQAYRTFQTAHSTEANVLEMLMNTINKINEELSIANQNNIQLRARVVQLEVPVKKLDKVTETVPVMPPNANTPKETKIPSHTPKKT